MPIHRSQPQAAPASAPPDTRIYAIGDVHGQLGLLSTLWMAIGRDAASATETRRLLVHLGDYVDRGPHSRGVVEALARREWRMSMALSGAEGVEVVSLAGNHEAMMLDAIAEGADVDAARFWVDNGGAATLRSYGLDPGYGSRHAWAWGIEPSHRSWLRGLPLLHREGGYVFTHAGLRPGVALEAQDRSDLQWIREPFLSHPGPFGAVAVHGHTPGPAPVVRDNRIGVDTGAAFGGPLTCVVLWSDQLCFLAADPGPRSSAA